MCMRDCVGGIDKAARKGQTLPGKNDVLSTLVQMHSRAADAVHHLHHPPYMRCGFTHFSLARR